MVDSADWLQKMESFYAEKAAGFGQSRQDSTLIPRSMRSMNHHKLGDRGASCINPANELDGKLRNPQRRRVPVAVCISTSRKSALSLTTVLV